MNESKIFDLSVRALIALALTVTTCFLWGTGQVVPPELLVLNSSVVAYYLGNRQTDQATQQVLTAAGLGPLPKPAVDPGA